MSQVGKRNLSNIPKPLTIGRTSGMTNTKPSDELGGSEWIVTLPSILSRVEASIRAFA